jgi:hypothetical protein
MENMEDFCVSHKYIQIYLFLLLLIIPPSSSSFSSPLPHVYTCIEGRRRRLAGRMKRRREGG